jgi:hypothetical protein
MLMWDMLAIRTSSEIAKERLVLKMATLSLCIWKHYSLKGKIKNSQPSTILLNMHSLNHFLKIFNLVYHQEVVKIGQQTI